MTKEQVKAIFLLSGLEVKAIHEAINNYWGKNDVTGPWWLVETLAGIVTIGWRKRVIHIDWNTTGIEHIPTQDDVTKGVSGAHAWTYAKAVEYLASFRRHVESLPVENNGKE